MRNRMMWIVLSIFCLLCSGHNLSGAQKASKPAGKTERITIQFVSFPDPYQKYEVYPWETLAIDDFRKAYVQMIGVSSAEEWTRSLTGTGNKNRMLYVFKRHLLLIALCRQHSCDTQQIIVLFDPGEQRCFAMRAVDGKFDYLGKPDEGMKNLLRILLADEYKDIYRGQ